MERNRMRILVVAGHPADMFDHCGGTLKHHIDNGDAVTCVSITQGLRIHDEVISDVFRHKVGQFTEEEVQKLIAERQKVKYKEAVEACGLFGIKDIRFLDYDDEILTVSPAMITKLAKLMREVQPNVVITHWPYQGDMFSNHHAVTGQLAMAAITAASGVNFEDRNPACRLSQIFFMLCPDDVFPGSALGYTRQAYAQYYVDISDCADLKVKAVNTMKSQKYDLKGYAKKTTEYWNGNFGQKVCLPYAEAFVLNSPEVGTLLPLSDHREWLGTADEGELLLRRASLSATETEIEERTDYKG
ncbi:MAG: PIG-L family deacetylase [Lachnospiraceae bacterium]|nr:PIG-L family deacetylase [Lachnospiraceae bacterium]